jgi:hypothetical protein
MKFKTLDALAAISAIPPLAENDPSLRSRLLLLDIESDNRESDAKAMTPEQIRARGWEYWRKIYTSGSEALLEGMHRGYPDMGLFSLRNT